MVDFNKLIKNSNKFREPALLFITTGHYCSYPEGTSEFFVYWDEQMDRCKNGYTADDGDFISGYNYFYLNFCPIQRIIYTTINNPDGSTKIKKTRDLLFPDFYDYDYYFFQAVEDAEGEGKHLCALKSRRKGYSYKNASMACRNYYLFPGSKTYIYASNKQYLTEDGILTKAWDYMDFIDKNTAWGKKRSVNTQMRKRAGFFTKDEYGNEIELGFKSEIIGVTLKDNPDVVRGKAGKLIIFEEAGSFSELGAAWQIARPSVEQDGMAFGTMIAFGTGGDEDSHFETLKDMFYNPDGYNCIGFDNIWDETPSDKKCGFFIPQYTNMDFRDDNGNRMFMDIDGNTLRKKSVEYILSERRKVIENATNSVAVDRYVAEHCLDGDTWISTEDGVTRIKDNPKAWISGVKDVYRLTTEDGTELLLTDNHKIFDGKLYRELKDYKVGDPIKYYNTEFSEVYQHVSVPGLIPATNTSILIDEDWGRFLGLFMGDGFFYGPSGAIGLVFDKLDIDSIKWAEAFFNLNFGGCNKTEIGKLKGGIELRVSRKGSIEIFKALQLLRSNSNGNLMRRVYIPEYILKSPKSVVSAFLSGLFDSDGYSSKDGNHVGFFSKEKLVLLDMLFLLRGFDIHASVKSRNSINGNGYTYIENKLNIRKIDIPKFRELIGFISYRKNEHIKDTKPSKSMRDYSYGKIVSIEYIKTDKVWDINTITHALSANGVWVHNCITPLEACLEFGGNIFPKKELLELLATIRTNKHLSNHKLIGDLIWEKDGTLKWVIKKFGDITHYPLKKDDDPTGSIVIWEHPVKDAPIGLYILGVDPYDHDQSGTNSLGSTFVYKRFQDFENYYDIIVAEYTGRPSTAEEYYENLRKLAVYYNGRIMYENERKGLFPYFTAKHCDYLLADQPDIISDVVGNSKVQRKKGCHMNKLIKQWGEGLIKDWLNEELAPGKKNLHNILSEPLLEELISYNDTGNFDRVMALMQVMIYRELLYNVKVKEKKKENKNRVLFEGPIFTQEWYRDDDTIDNIKAYMF
ncbi:terminase [uncultured phage cr56_1]|uniref:Terminase n=1 Tax=uncultured phage cr56_1 TaxID=2772081 RepID=A0A7M1RSV9_9CAUD|nr:terminase large subunit [uncultured phage cr56_1]QOR56882.1 terminase [uncultured phage cr56_1]